MVVLEHISWKGVQYLGAPLAWFHIGGGGVDIFFIISGFIMCHATAGKYNLSGNVTLFIKKRLIRIIPLYWLLSLCALVLYIIMPERINTSGGETNVFLSFFLIPLPTEQAFLLKNGWTLSYEFYFYFIFSFGMIFREQIGRRLVSIILLALVVTGFLLENKGLYTRFLTNAVLIEFLFGIIIYNIYKNYKNISLYVPVILVLSSVILFFLLNQQGGVFCGKRIFDYGIPSFLICLGLTLLEEPISKHKFLPLQMLGDSSYSMYLFHPFVLSGFILVFDLSGFLNEKWAYLIICLMLVSAIVSGYLCYVFVEKKMDKKLRRLMKKSN